MITYKVREQLGSTYCSNTGRYSIYKYYVVVQEEQYLFGLYTSYNILTKGATFHSSPFEDCILKFYTEEEACAVAAEYTKVYGDPQDKVMFYK